MDIYCTKCGEPWDIYTVKHDAPHEPNEWILKGSRIIECPCCIGKQIESNPYIRKIISAQKVCDDLLGDDIDAQACMMEDFID